MRIDNFRVVKVWLCNSSHLFILIFEKNKKDKSVQNKELICRPWFYSLCSPVGTEDKNWWNMAQSSGPPHSQVFFFPLIFIFIHLFDY